MGSPRPWVCPLLLASVSPGVGLTPLVMSWRLCPAKPLSPAVGAQVAGTVLRPLLVLPFSLSHRLLILAQQMVSQPVLWLCVPVWLHHYFLLPLPGMWTEWPELQQLSWARRRGGHGSPQSQSQKSLCLHAGAPSPGPPWAAHLQTSEDEPKKKIIYLVWTGL